MQIFVKLSLLFVMALVAGAASAQAVSEVALKWTSGNTGTSALPICPATSPKACVSGFTLSMDGTTLAGPTTLSSTATSYTQTPLPAAGTHNYSLVMNGYDGLGNAITSTAATATVTIPATVTLNPPTGFTVTLQ